jgi:hypothetical protein
MTSRAYVIKGFHYIDYEVIAPKQIQEEYKESPIQIPVTKGTVKSTNHEGNVIDVLRQIYNMPVSLPDIGINAERSAKIHSFVTDLSPNISEKNDRRKKVEEQVVELRASEYTSKTIAMVQERRKSELSQGIDTFWSFDTDNRYFSGEIVIYMGRNRSARRQSCPSWGCYV